MRGVFDDQQLEPVEARRDTELTLGSGALVAAFLGLLLLCGLCFGLGYAVGHRGSQSSVAEATTAAPATSATGSIAKPSATSQSAPAPLPDISVQPTASAGASPESNAATQPATSQPPPSAASAETRPALAPAVLVAQSGQPASTSSAHPAMVPAVQLPAVQLMVQIAAVSNPEDAEVLTTALRKRGYLVTVRRDPADNLIHVRIGPFASQAEANGWRMKLLNDGYNAIVQ
jgi:cell division septation protein DedD